LEAFLIASRLGSRRTGTVAAWFTALFPPLVWYADAFTSETVSAALVGGWAAAGMAYVDEGGRWRRATAVLVLGAPLSLVRAVLLTLAPFPSVARGAVSRPAGGRRGAGLAAPAAAIVLARWAVYTQPRFGETVVLSRGGGGGLWTASHDPPL